MLSLNMPPMFEAVRLGGRIVVWCRIWDVWQDSRKTQHGKAILNDTPVPVFRMEGDLAWRLELSV
jgi:hypothetical protein